MKNTYYITFLLLILFACTKKGSSSKTEILTEDSLSIYLSKANDFGSTPQKRQEYIQKAYEIVINQPNDSMSRVNMFRVANRYYNINNWKSYKSTVQIVLGNAIMANDSISISKAYTYLGDYYGYQSVPDSAFIYYFKAEKMYLQLGDKHSLARTRINKAMLLYNGSDFSGSEISVFKALRVLKGYKSDDIIYESYNLLGLIYNELGEYDKAIDFQTKALASIDDQKSPIEFQSRATSLNNMGYIYQNLNQHEKAIPYFKKALEKKQDLILYKPTLYATLLDNLAYSKFKIGELDKVFFLLSESLKLRDSLRLTSGIINSKLHLSEYYAYKNDTVKSLMYSKEALLTARQSKNFRNALLPLKRLAVIEPENAAIYNREYIHINDSLQKADRNIADKFSRIEYETEAIKQENTDLTTQNRNLVYIFGSILILGMFFYIIKAQKAKNRELMYKQEQQKANEEIYNMMISQQNNVEVIRIKEKKRVAQELHDGVLGRMFGVRMNLDSLNKTHDNDAYEQRISYLNELKNIEQDIREISHDLNREKSELINNFVAIVDNLLEDQKKTFKTTLVSTIDSNIKWDLMSNTNKINLFRVVQESLHNCNKYANASAIKIEFKKVENNLFLQISDDGIGFNIKKAKRGIGLQNMKSRINECKGIFEIKSKKDQGTIITVTVPI